MKYKMCFLYFRKLFLLIFAFSDTNHLHSEKCEDCYIYFIPLRVWSEKSPTRLHQNALQ